MHQNNKILSTLGAIIQGLLAQLELVDLRAGEVLCESGKVAIYVHFPATALLALMAQVDDGCQVCIGMVGKEGMSNPYIANGSMTSVCKVMVQCAGQALRIQSKLLLKELGRNALLREALHRHSLSQTMQFSSMTACNHYHEIEKRLAKWLLMTRDRISSDHFYITHEMLAHILGVRRVGVTNAATALKGHGVIDYSRGRIEIVDGPKLQEMACTCYALPIGRNKS